MHRYISLHLGPIDVFLTLAVILLALPISSRARAELVLEDNNAPTSDGMLVSPLDALTAAEKSESLFELYIDDDSLSSKGIIGGYSKVVHDGVNSKAKWNTCYQTVTSEKATGPVDDIIKNCYSLNQFMDQLDFDYSFENLNEFYFQSKPKIKFGSFQDFISGKFRQDSNYLTQESDYNVKGIIYRFDDLVHYAYDDAELEGTLQIKTLCQEPDSYLIVTVSISIQSSSSSFMAFSVPNKKSISENINFAFLKKCGRGTFSGVDLGYYDLKDQDLRSSRPIASFEKRLPQVLSLSTQIDHIVLFLKPKPTQPAILAYHSFNCQVSDPSMLKVSIRGIAPRGMLRSDQPLTLRSASKILVVFHCKDNGEAVITIKFNIFPFNDIEYKIRKTCNANVTSHVSGLRIESDHPLAKLVYDQGKIEPPYNILRRNEIQPPSGFLQLHKDENVMVFVLVSSVAGQIEKLVLSKIVVSSTDSSSVFVRSENRLGEKPLILKDIPIEVLVRMVCIKEGHADVVVSLLFAEYPPLEFGFQKNCGNPKIFEQNMYFTAQTGMAVFMVGGGLIMIMVYFCLCSSTQGSIVSERRTKTPHGTNAAHTGSPVRLPVSPTLVNLFNDRSNKVS